MNESMATREVSDMKPTTHPVRFVFNATPDMERLLKAEHHRLQEQLGVKISMSQTISVVLHRALSQQPTNLEHHND